MKITLLINRARNNQVDKTSFLEFVDTIEGNYRTILDVDNPVFTLRKDNEVPPNFNYIYVEELNTYYYVEHIDIINYELFTAECHIDVLMTFRNYIYNLEAFVDRNEFSYEVNAGDDEDFTAFSRRHLVDDRIITSNEIDIEDNVVINYVFNAYASSNGTFCLTGLGLRHIDLED